ncbi:MAG: superinfection immunity protein [Alphaproteobacteria bacterium]|nr:superinfection immunity protein [Alphaproteobacteria bacterium]
MARLDSSPRRADRFHYPDWKLIVALNWLPGWAILGWVATLVGSFRPIATATPAP